MKPQTASQINIPQCGELVFFKPMDIKPVYHGTKVVFGVPKVIRRLVLPPDTDPNAKVRLRFRSMMEGKVFIKTKNSIRCFVLKDCGDYWEPWAEIGMNFRL